MQGPEALAILEAESLASLVQTISMKLLHVFHMLGVGLAGTRVAAEAQPREFAKKLVRVPDIEVDELIRKCSCSTGFRAFWVGKH